MRMQKKESSDALFKLSCLSIWAVLLILFRIKLNTGNPVWRQKKENCAIPCCDEGSPSNIVARNFPPNGYPYPCLKYFRLKIGGIGGYYVPPLYRQSATLTPDNFTHKGKQGFLGSKWTKGLNGEKRGGGYVFFTPFTEKIRYISIIIRRASIQNIKQLH